MPSVINWAGLIVAIFALLYGWLQQRRIATIERRLDRYNKALYDANAETRALREQLEIAVASLQSEIKISHGATRFAATMTVKDAQLVHPYAQPLMASLGLGGCSSCAEDSLLVAARDHGVNLDQLMTRLNALPDLPANGAAFAAIKVPNVSLELDN